MSSSSQLMLFYSRLDFDWSINRRMWVHIWVGTLVFFLIPAFILALAIEHHFMLVSFSSPSIIRTTSRRFIHSMKIGTHSGTFHCDEALAVYMLKTLPQWKDASVTRTRDPDTLEACDIIVDVSGQYDGTKHFDHHQRGFEETFDAAHNTKLSSAGLVYKHFGKEIIANSSTVKENDDSMNLIYTKVYDEFIEGIDANDNGISAYGSAEPAFKIAISLPTMVAHLNPRWNEEHNDSILDEKFTKASELVGHHFTDRVSYYTESWLPARSGVYNAISSRQTPEIVVFETFLPWKDHLFQIEKELQIENKILYVLYPDGKAWRIQAVPKTITSFESRKALPEQWRGVRDDKLSEVSGIEGGIFVHASGFIGGNKTKQGALDMASKALHI